MNQHDKQIHEAVWRRTHINVLWFYTSNIVKVCYMSMFLLNRLNSWSQTSSLRKLQRWIKYYRYEEVIQQVHLKPSYSLSHWEYVLFFRVPVVWRICLSSGLLWTSQSQTQSKRSLRRRRRKRRSVKHIIYNRHFLYLQTEK